MSQHQPWTFARYWREVFGPFSTSLSFLSSMEVPSTDPQAVSELVQTMEDGAFEDSGLRERPPEWKAYRARARTLLLDALSVYDASEGEA